MRYPDELKREALNLAAKPGVTVAQVERTHRTLKEQTEYRYFYQTPAEFRQRLEAFMQADECSAHRPGSARRLVDA